MSTMEPYGVEKDLKILKGSSRKHKASLEGQFMGIIPGPEVEVKVEKGKRTIRSTIIRGVEDPKRKITLDVADKEKNTGPFREMLHLIGLDQRESDFVVISTLDSVLRALAKAKFKNLGELKFNGKLVYDHPEKEWDLKVVLPLLKDMRKGEKLEEAEARVILKEEGDVEAVIKVDKVHTELTHDIYIDFKGELEGEMLRRVINYLEEHLEIEELLES